ncbi:HTH-type transcriptional activator CmpR [Pelotomaculum sp. FP]|uniref:LysR family transcriptional regulator n=1 Tax=Pelotomaculum sp. FP TaxID=261474 RepID=UPI001100C316|nr:LysR family transcriptional regulator [Pelotomaculum sp. FP]TEB15396.1 HTH-type transcriptional activator CmpR [Pelotomaculum sp. FP]
MPELNLYQLKIFYTVARHLNYSRAGEELALSQPAVSRQVAALEKSLGLELFVQKGRHVELTDAGRSLFDYADRIFDLADEAERAMSQFKDLERGQVLIGASTTIGSYILPPVLRAFQERYPKIELSLHLANSATVEQMVTARKLDLGLVGGLGRNQALHIEPYFQDDLVMISSHKHPYNRKEEVSTEDLHKETLLWREKGSAVRTLVERFLSDNQYLFKNQMEVSDTETIKHMVIAGIGIAFVPKRAVRQELSLSLLRTVNDSKFLIPIHFTVISAKDQHTYPTVLAFSSFLRKWPVS